MSSSAGNGDDQAQHGRGKKFSLGKAFLKRMAYRLRGGNATSEMNATQVTCGPKDPSNHLVLDVSKIRQLPSEPEAKPTLAVEIQSDVLQLPSQPDPNMGPIPIASVRGVDRHERTRRLLAKYGLSVEAQDWMPVNAKSPTTVLRVEKQIRG
ncbi:hypothetical protein FKW77_007714 [Venturia effusa]|uniref:Uncharacterized protein n=1 Tax=Venturia effusa TaxID=50376 RepID=A0A517LCP7_9PEZI|nr:hypothetical protein FKW77_007714 [Venturia effusa]